MNLEKIKEIVELMRKGVHMDDITLQMTTKYVDDNAATLKDELDAAEKAYEVETGKELDAKQKADKAELDAKVKASVDEVLEGMKTEGLFQNKSEPAREVKLFNPQTGKCQEYNKMPEGHKALADMLYYSHRKDQASVERVAKEIEEEVKKDCEVLGIKTPLYSDATTGSKLIPTEVASEILEMTYNLSEMYQKANKANVIYNDKLFPIMSDMSFAFITDESTAISDKTPTINDPTVSMNRYGGLAILSNTLIQMRSPEVVRAIISQMANANAQFIDLYTAAGSVTTDSDPFNGLIFDANTGGITAKALANISDNDFINLIEKLSFKVDDITFIANRKVRNKYGQIEDTGGGRIFKDFMSNGSIAPMGHDFIENRRIPSTLTINASSGSTNTRAGGSSDAIIAADLSKLYLGIDPMRIDMSEHYKFNYDQTAWRAVGRIGSKVVSGSSDAGIVAAVLELTN